MVLPWRAFIAAGLLLLSGCASDDDDYAAPGPGTSGREALTEPVHAIGQHLDHTFVGQTGTQLYVDYVLPEPLPEGGAPVILVFTPYQDADAGLDAGEGDPVVPDAPYNENLVATYVPYGYAVAFADVRGNHNAGGCVDQTGPEQWRDGYDYVEWLGTQGWSNGKVGMFGISYDGETQFTTAMMAPPHLATIVPMSSVSNQYEWNFYQGVPYELQPLLGMGAYFQGSAVPSTTPRNAALYAEKLECQDEMMMAGVDFSGDMTPFWKERDYRPMAKQIQASVLHVHGLADWNVRPIHIDPLFNDITAEKRALFGQWGHQYPLRDDWAEILHAWYDHFLFGRDNGILEQLPPVLIQDNHEQWHGIGSFPALDADWMELELSADGTLTAVGQAEGGQLEVVDFPEEVGTGIPGVDVTSAPAALDGQDRLEFSFKTTQELRIVGRPEVVFTAVTDTTSTHWVAHLTVDGAECLNTEVICENAGYQDTRHREGLDNPKDLEPDVPYNLTIRMYPQYDVIPAGSTVRLVLTNNDSEVSQDDTFARSLVSVGDGHALLRLPLHPGGVPLPSDELPDVYPGYVGPA
ncbi:MAG TPA: CocE/NonD family hydrolase [Candidatus Thermoplasmatota archaeon]|nr:CocE/NonD family hydrolase [Candidatus Thermoplasmatota archaeon]